MNSHQSVPELRSLWSNSEFFNFGSDILLFKTTTCLMEMDETKVASKNISLNGMDEGKEALTHFIGS